MGLSLYSLPLQVIISQQARSHDVLMLNTLPTVSRYDARDYSFPIGFWSLQNLISGRQPHNILFTHLFSTTWLCAFFLCFTVFNRYTADTLFVIFMALFSASNHHFSSHYRIQYNTSDTIVRYWTGSGAIVWD